MFMLLSSLNFLKVKLYIRTTVLHVFGTNDTVNRILLSKCFTNGNT